jgi:hypothetical protein
MIIREKVNKEQRESACPVVSMEIESAKSALELLVRYWREDRVLEALPTFLRPTNGKKAITFSGRSRH